MTHTYFPLTSKGALSKHTWCAIFPHEHTYTRAQTHRHLPRDGELFEESLANGGIKGAGEAHWEHDGDCTLLLLDEVELACSVDVSRRNKRGARILESGLQDTG